MMRIKNNKDNSAAERTYEQIEAHYEIEKELANRLRDSTKDERKVLYSSVYDELFRKVPSHPMLTRKTDAESRQRKVRLELRNLSPLLNRDAVFLEIGPGDCSLALELTKIVKKVYAVDTSEEIVRAGHSLPDNLEVIISDGVSINVPANSVDAAYSNQLVEHLHPDDIAMHIENVRNCLKPGGIYFFQTPHRFNGPHDVSKYFDQIATGLHLKEWTNSELMSLLKEHRFSKIKVKVNAKKFGFIVPIFLVQLLEWLLGILPYKLRKGFSQIPPINTILGIRIIAMK